MTRTHKLNDRDHQAVPAPRDDRLPRYFAKHGYSHENPNKTKKNGGGKANWGGAGEEMVDGQFNFTNARRRSNSSGYSNNLRDFKTKFELNDPEPVFEEEVPAADPETETDSDAHPVGPSLAKTDSASSAAQSAAADEDEDKPAK